METDIVSLSRPCWTMVWQLTKILVLREAASTAYPHSLEGRYEVVMMQTILWLRRDVESVFSYLVPCTKQKVVIYLRMGDHLHPSGDKFVSWFPG